MLNADEARAKKLMEMDAEKAAEEMKAEGFDVTADELAEFNKIMSEIIQPGQDLSERDLDEKALEKVAGGYGYYYYGYYYYYNYYPRYYYCCCHCHCHW